MAFEEYGQKIRIGYSGGIKDHHHALRMSGQPCDHLLICGIWCGAARIANGSDVNAIEIPEPFFRAPEFAHGEAGGFKPFRIWRLERHAVDRMLSAEPPSPRRGPAGFRPVVGMVVLRLNMSIRNKATPSLSGFASSGFGARDWHQPMLSPANHATGLRHFRDKQAGRLLIEPDLLRQQNGRPVSFGGNR
jgi:hypothetical protein